MAIGERGPELGGVHSTPTQVPHLGGDIEARLLLVGFSLTVRSFFRVYLLNGAAGLNYLEALQ